MKQKSILFISSMLLLTVFSASHSFSKNNTENKTNKIITEDDRLYTQCLKEKGLVFYGTSWCPHCKQQKATFGELINQITYIDCEENPKECRSKKVTGYPTLLLPDGKEIQQGSIKEIAEDAGCNIDELKNQVSKENSPKENSIIAPDIIIKD